MAQLCFVTGCMGRLSSLKQSLGRMAGQPGCSCVVVDYSCPDGAGDWVEAHFPGVRVVRRPGHAAYNRSAAKNAGAAAADAPWIGFVDADILLAADFARDVLPTLRPGAFYRLISEDRERHGTFLCRREDFHRAGGFDELFQGWGEEDNDMYDALAFAGVAEQPLPEGIFAHLPHADEERVKHHDLKDRTISSTINFLYRTMKWDQARLDRQLQDRNTLAELYQIISREVRRSWSDGRPAELGIRSPGWRLEGKWKVVRKLVYELVMEEGA